MLSEQEIVRRGKLEKLKAAGVPLYPERYEITHDLTAASQLPDGQKDVSVAGRILTIRRFGKLTFFTIQDVQHKLQICIKQDVIGEQAYEQFHSLVDMGDFIGGQGEMFTTKTG